MQAGCGDGGLLQLRAGALEEPDRAAHLADAGGVLLVPLRGAYYLREAVALLKGQLLARHLRAWCMRGRGRLLGARMRAVRMRSAARLACSSYSSSFRLLPIVPFFLMETLYPRGPSGKSLKSTMGCGLYWGGTGTSSIAAESTLPNRRQMGPEYSLCEREGLKAGRSAVRACQPNTPCLAAKRAPRAVDKTDRNSPHTQRSRCRSARSSSTSLGPLVFALG